MRSYLSVVGVVLLLDANVLEGLEESLLRGLRGLGGLLEWNGGVVLVGDAELEAKVNDELIESLDDEPSVANTTEWVDAAAEELALEVLESDEAEETARAHNVHGWKASDASAGAWGVNTAEGEAVVLGTWLRPVGDGGQGHPVVVSVHHLAVAWDVVLHSHLNDAGLKVRWEPVEECELGDGGRHFGGVMVVCKKAFRCYMNRGLWLLCLVWRL